MKKMMSVFFALVLSSMAFANAPVDIKFEGTASGIEVSVSGVNQDKAGKNDNTVKVYKYGAEVAKFKLTNGSGSILVQGVKCDEQIEVAVFNVSKEDSPNSGSVHRETSKLRRNYSASNCPQDSKPTPAPKKKTNVSLSATGTASGVEVTITGVSGGTKTAVVYDSNGNVLGSMQVTNGTSTQRFDGVSCDEYVYAIVKKADADDAPDYKGEVRTNNSSRREDMTGTNCNTAPVPAPRPTEPSSSEE